MVITNSRKLQTTSTLIHTWSTKKQNLVRVINLYPNRITQFQRTTISRQFKRVQKRHQVQKAARKTPKIHLVKKATRNKQILKIRMMMMTIITSLILMTSTLLMVSQMLQRRPAKGMEVMRKSQTNWTRSRTTSSLTSRSTDSAKTSRTTSTQTRNLEVSQPATKAARIRRNQATVNTIAKKRTQAWHSLKHTKAAKYTTIKIKIKASSSKSNNKITTQLKLSLAVPKTKKKWSLLLKLRILRLNQNKLKMEISQTKVALKRKMEIRRRTKPKQKAKLQRNAKAENQGKLKTMMYKELRTRKTTSRTKTWSYWKGAIQ